MFVKKIDHMYLSAIKSYSICFS